MSGARDASSSEPNVAGRELAVAKAPEKTCSEEQPSKRSKKSKRKVALTPAELDLVRVVPVPKRSTVLAEQPAVMQLSKVDLAPQIQLTEDRLTATFHKGYRMVRATHGAYQGTWYFEVTCGHLGETGHCRLGWSSNKGELQGPVGYDEHSFAYRDIEGVKVHKASRQEYGEPFREGDILGCFIHMPEGGKPFEKAKSDIVTWKGSLYFLDGEAQEPRVLTGSLIAFSRNGVSQGPAFRDFLEGKYYPAISMYTLPEQKEGASVTVNFGPEFRYDPLEIEGCPHALPACELTREPAFTYPPESAGAEGKSEDAAGAQVAAAMADGVTTIEKLQGPVLPLAPDQPV